MRILFLSLVVFTCCLGECVFGQNRVFKENIVTSTETSFLMSDKIYAMDFTGDGNLDIMCSSFYGGVIIAENNGSQEFFDTHILNSHDLSTRSFESGLFDWDGDGDLDILQFYSGGELIWYEKKEDGVDGYERKIAMQLDVKQIASMLQGDIDGDGDMDFVISSYTENYVIWYENQGGGNYQKKGRLIKESYSNNSYEAIGLNDMDGDGDIDLVAISYYGYNMIWSENDGTGNFIEHEIYRGQYGGEKLNILDWDNDNDLDIILTLNSKSIYCYENNGNAVFEGRILISRSQFLSNYVINDLDNDGDWDIVYKTGVDTKVAFYENDGNSVFQEIVINDVFTERYSSGALFISDLDKDGDKDIIYNDGGTVWCENNGQESFTKHYIRGRQRPVFFEVGDFNGDNFDDIVSVGVQPVLQIYENNQENHFRQSVEDEFSYSFKDLRVCDLDTDGDLDFIVSSSSGSPDYYSSIQWYENDGMGAFTQHFLFSKSSVKYIDEVEVADFDGDGDLDIVYENDKYTSTYKTHIGCLINNGEGEFIHSVHLEGKKNEIFVLKAGDIDGDGDIDLCGGVFQGDNLMWYVNDGEANFESNLLENEVVSEKSVNCFDIGDLDNDGDLDIFSLSHHDESTFSWYENDGMGRFEQNYIEGITLNDIESIDLKDLDNDGSLDVLVSSFEDSTIAWLSNDGEGNFTPYIISENIPQALIVTAGKINKDNQQDIIYLSRGEHKIAWLEDVILSSNIGGLSNGDTVTTEIALTIEFNMEVEENLTLEDIIISNGTVSNLQKVPDSNNYTVVITPDQDGAFSVTIPADSFHSGEYANRETKVTAFYDITPPSITSIDVPSPSTYHQGDKLTFTVNFSEEIVLDGETELTINYNTTDNIVGHWVAKLTSSTATSLTFEYTVQDGDEDLDGLTLETLKLEGTIQDKAGHDAILDLNNISDLSGVFVDANANTPSITESTTDEDTPSNTGLVISRNLSDGEEVTHFQITEITDGKLYLSDGETEIQNGDFITYEQGAEGLVFVPNENYTGTATFKAQSSLRGDESGLGGDKVTAFITVNPVNDIPIALDVEDINRTYGDGKAAAFDITPYLYDIENTAQNLNWSVSSSDEEVAVVAVIDGVLNFDLIHVGESIITVTAVDLEGEKNSVLFKVIISPAILTVTPNNKSREYAFPNPELDGEIEGFQYNDSGVGIYDTEADKSSEVGVYDITVVDVEMTEGERTDYILNENIGELEVFSNNRLFIPTLFSPNGDGSNDTFFISSYEISDLLLKIYDRSGTLLFETKSLEVATGTGWDGTYNGKQMAAGNYVWQLAGKFRDGSELSFEGKTTGVVTLVR